MVESGMEGFYIYTDLSWMTGSSVFVYMSAGWSCSLAVVIWAYVMVCGKHT